VKRRQLLRRLIKRDERFPIQFSDHFECDGVGFFKAAAGLGLEGIVSKRAASRYRSGPSRSWLTDFSDALNARTRALARHGVLHAARHLGSQAEEGQMRRPHAAGQTLRAIARLVRPPVAGSVNLTRVGNRANTQMTRHCDSGTFRLH
jgi:hypothetical protein